MSGRQQNRGDGRDSGIASGRNVSRAAAIFGEGEYVVVCADDSYSNF